MSSALRSPDLASYQGSFSRISHHSCWPSSGLQQNIYELNTRRTQQAPPGGCVHNAGSPCYTTHADAVSAAAKGNGRYDVASVWYWFSSARAILPHGLGPAPDLFAGGRFNQNLHKGCFYRTTQDGLPVRYGIGIVVGSTTSNSWRLVAR